VALLLGNKFNQLGFCHSSPLSSLLIVGDRKTVPVKYQSLSGY
jgi:hypothetical protein